MQVLCTSGVEFDAFMYSSADGLVMVIFVAFDVASCFGGRYRMGDQNRCSEWCTERKGLAQTNKKQTP